MRTPTKPPQSDFLPRIGAGCLLILGLFMSVSAVIAVATQASANPGLFVMALIGIGFAAAGVYWWRFVTGSEVRRSHEFQDKAVLEVAARHGGCATLAQISLETDLSTDEARITVERLCIRGFAAPDFREDGSIEYRFGGLLDR